MVLKSIGNAVLRVLLWEYRSLGQNDGKGQRRKEKLSVIKLFQGSWSECWTLKHTQIMVEIEEIDEGYCK